MQYDIIVVGGGGSGLAAAVSALQAGLRVLVLEKNDQLGGTTGIAVGSFTTAGSRFQHQANVEDSIEDHIVDAGKFAPPDIEARNNESLRAFFLSHSSATLEWLEALGVQFVGPHPEPPNRQPRMHNATAGAKAYIAALQLEIQRRGGSVQCGARVLELVVDEQGAVCGVRYQLGGRDVETSSRAVVLAGGDYSNNPELIARHKGEQYRDIEGINPFADGAAHVLAEAAGAEMVNMDVTYGPELRFVAGTRQPFQQWLPVAGWRARVVGWCAQRAPRWLTQKLIKRLLVTWQHPEDALFTDGAILVNSAGERFVDETCWPDREIELARQPGKVGYIFLSKELARKYSAWPHFISTAPDIAYAYTHDYLNLRPDVAMVGTLTEMSQRRGISEDALRETVGSENESGVLLGPVKAYFTTTEGGAAVNQQQQVLDKNAQPIPGLYAVGQTGLGGMILFGHGLHIAWAMTSGRLAGRHVAEALAAEDGRTN